MPTFKPHKKFAVTVEVTVEAKDDGVTLMATDSVTAAVRYYLRRILPPKFNAAGYRYDLATLDVTTEEIHTSV